MGCYTQTVLAAQQNTYLQRPRVQVTRGGSSFRGIDDCSPPTRRASAASCGITRLPAITTFGNLPSLSNFIDAATANSVDAAELVNVVRAGRLIKRRAGSALRGGVANCAIRWRARLTWVRLALIVETPY